METSLEVKKLVLNDVHEALGAKMTPFAGYMMPLRYTGDIDEHMAVRESVGIFDVSHMGEFMVKGPGALDLIQFVSSNDASVLVPGRAQYAYLPNRDGGIVDDMLVYKISNEEYMLVVNASNLEKDWEWINSNNSFGAELTNISDDTSLFAVQGPKAVDTVRKLAGESVDEIPYYGFSKMDVAGLGQMIVSGTGYTGAGGFEIYVPNAKAVELWQKIMEVGQEFNIKPAGLGARDTLRLEMGYCLYGNDIDDSTSPFDAKLGWVTKFTKGFINSENLKNDKEGPRKRLLCGLKMIDRGIPRAGYELCDESGQIIGKITSGSMSPSLGVGIGLGYIDKNNSAIGTNIYVNVRNRQLKAEVIKLPFV